VDTLFPLALRGKACPATAGAGDRVVKPIKEKGRDRAVN